MTPELRAISAKVDAGVTLAPDERAALKAAAHAVYAEIAGRVRFGYASADDVDLVRFIESEAA